MLNKLMSHLIKTPKNPPKSHLKEEKKPQIQTIFFNLTKQLYFSIRDASSKLFVTNAQLN